MGEQGTDILWVYVTTSSKEEAEKIGEEVVQKRLAACANILPSMESFYWWEGRVVNDQEAVLILKTTKERFAALVDEVKKLHRYTVPCIIALPVVAGNSEYLEWLRKETETQSERIA